MGSYILLVPRTDTTICIVNYLFSNLFAPWTGTLFADLYGLNLFWEVELFYIEHLLALLILPIIMLL